MTFEFSARRYMRGLVGEQEDGVSQLTGDKTLGVDGADLGFTGQAFMSVRKRVADTGASKLQKIRVDQLHQAIVMSSH